MMNATKSDPTFTVVLRDARGRKHTYEVPAANPDLATVEAMQKLWETAGVEPENQQVVSVRKGRLQ